MRTPRQSSSDGFSTTAQPCRYGLSCLSLPRTRRELVFQMGCSTTYPTDTRRLPSPAKLRLTAFFCASWDWASASSAFLNSASRTGLRKRTRCTSPSLTPAQPVGAPQVQHRHLDGGVLAGGLLLGLDAD